ncbi:MAG: T9SS type A sorting domain-containing protein [Balneolaceae bacterium]
MALFIFGANVITKSQESDSLLYCGTVDTESNNNVIYKSKMTADDTYGEYITANGILKVLVVFVRFPDDNSSHYHWNSTGFPTMADEFIDSTVTQGNTNYANVTNYFDEMSFGNYKVIGDVVKVTAPKPSTESTYQQSNSQYLKRREATIDVLNAIDGQVDFSEYDSWGNNSRYSNDNSSDGTVDMIFMTWKGGDWFGNWTGEASLGYGASINLDGVDIKFGYGSGSSGSGLTVHDNHNTQRTLNTTKHELGHWLLGGSHPYDSFTASTTGIDYRIPSIMQHGQGQGLSANASERERLGWITVSEITSNTTGLELDDFITTGEAYKYDVTPNSSIDYEYYYFTNHQKLSIYDDATQNLSDKGLFILHDKNSTDNSYDNRMLVSDGDYVWDEDGVINNPWGGGQLSVFYKDYPSQNGRNITQMQYSNTQNKYEKVFIYEEDGDTTQGALFTGREFITTFNKNKRPLFSSITNPAARSWSGSSTGFKLMVKEQTNNVIEFDVYTNFNSSSLSVNEIWDRQIFLDQNATVGSNTEISFLDGTVVYPITTQSLSFGNTSSFLIDNQGSATTVTIEDGITVNINSGANLELESGTGGLASNKTTLIVKGVLNINSGSTVDLGDHALIFVEDGGEVNVSSGATINTSVIGEFNAGDGGLVTFLGNTSYSSSICLMTLPGGTMEFNGSLTLDNGAFIQTPSVGGGTYIFNGGATLKGSGNSSGYVMDINDDTEVQVGYASKILTYSGAKIRAVGTLSNPVKFTYNEPTWDDANAWFGIEMRGDANIFEYSIVEGTVGEALYFRSDNNIVEYSNIRDNEDYGIRTYLDYSGGWGSVKISDSKIENNGSHGIYASSSYLGLEYNDIKNNGGDGIYVYNAYLGYPYNGGGYFRGNDIYNNSSNAVEIAYNGVVYDGYSTSVDGNNNLDRNNSHEVYLSSTSARWWDASGGSYTAVLENTSSTSTKYVYNLAQTTSGESTISWTVGMENNAWDYAAPSSGKFYGSVDYTPYQTTQMFGSVGPRGSVPFNLISNQPTIGIEQNVLSAAQLNVSLEGMESDDQKDDYLSVRKEIITLIGQIQNDPVANDIPKKLNGLIGYYNALPKNNRSEFDHVKSMIKGFVSEAHMNGGSVSQNERLASETALMLEANQLLIEGMPDQAFSKIESANGKFSNIDVEREAGFVEAEALTQLGEYVKAIKVYEKLTILSERGVDPRNTRTGFTDEIQALEELIEESKVGTEAEDSKVKPNSEITKEVLPTEFKLNAAYPNPFNPSTVLSFELPEAGKVRVDVYDISGRLVSVLTNQNFQAGVHSLTLDASNLASGVYLVRADIAGTLQSQKITLIK